MTGRTHDMAAFAALTLVVATQPLPQVTMATAIVAFMANMIGGLTPDIDQPTGDLWHKLPGGTLYSRLITPFLGGHRYISHSIVGILLFGYLSHWALGLAKNVLLVDMNIVWWAFMIGYVSHLIMDTITHEGVPWFFPIPWKIGFPPLEGLRVKTGGLVEKTLVFPGLILITGYLIYQHYYKFLALFHHLKN